jgi:hypothetical protein
MFSDFPPASQSQIVIFGILDHGNVKALLENV